MRASFGSTTASYPWRRPVSLDFLLGRSFLFFFLFLGGWVGGGVGAQDWPMKTDVWFGVCPIPPPPSRIRKKKKKARKIASCARLSFSPLPLSLLHLSSVVFCCSLFFFFFRPPPLSPPPSTPLLYSLGCERVCLFLEKSIIANLMMHDNTVI